MKKTCFAFACLFILVSCSQAQTFFVSGTDPRSVEKVTQKIRFEGYTLADSANANYIATLLIDGTYKVISFNYSYHGYIKITDGLTGKEICRSRVIGSNPAALNGYNAAYTIFTKIDRKYLPALLKQCLQVVKK